ncbi:NAD(P)/FAD-dependent oxidoreductase [Rhodosalinus sp. FB01]|uniref:NAD(P)/FAD-dependent oxidoreductase n=1 Tax=Rhodosalinus sp. FB01 TaxID=3239194 RepID=UPI0035231476
MGNLWEETAGEPALDAPPLQAEVEADLAIIGGGFTGAAAALWAAGQGARVVLLEAARIGHGGSGRNVGLVNAGLWLPPQDVMDTLGAEAGARLNAALAGAPELVFGLAERHGIACEPVRAGTLHCAHAPAGLAELRRRAGQLHAVGAPVRLIGAEDTAARTGASGLAGALHDPRAGTVQPLAYARGLARAARDRGAHIHENAQVTSLDKQKGAWHVGTAAGKAVAPRLLVATNAYHVPFPGMAVPRTARLSYFQLATAPLGAAEGAALLPGGEGCWDTGLVMTSFRRDASGRLILGAMGLPERGGRALHHDWARAKLARLFPALSGAAFDHAWSGWIAVTEDHVPRILRPAQGALAVFGYSGRGIAPGTLFGQAAARALLDGDESALPVTPVARYGESATLTRSLYYETGARLVHAWQRLGGA